MCVRRWTTSQIWSSRQIALPRDWGSTSHAEVIEATVGHFEVLLSVHESVRDIEEWTVKHNKKSIDVMTEALL